MVAPPPVHLVKRRVEAVNVCAALIDSVAASAVSNDLHRPEVKPHFEVVQNSAATGTWQSDEQLREVLAGMGQDPTDLHVDGDTEAITHTYADLVALALAMRRAADEDDELANQIQAARAGAAAFVFWADALLVTYVESTGSNFGTPTVTDKPPPDEPA